MLTPTASRTSRQQAAAGRTSLVGVDIGSTSIKFVQLERRGREQQTRVCRLVPHDEPLNLNDPWASLETILATLKRGWSRRNAWSRIPAACALTMGLLEFRIVQLDADPAYVTREQIEEAYLSHNPDQEGSWMVDGWPTSPLRPKGEPSHFGVIALHEQFACDLARGLWDCGLECQVIDGIPFALARLAEMTTSECVVMLDWGYSGLTVVVVDQGQPYYTRTLRECGLDVLSAALMKSLGVDRLQSRHLLEFYGLGGRATTSGATSDLKAAVGELTASFVRSLGLELQRTWSFLEQTARPRPIRAILTGGAAAIPDSAAVLGNLLQRPVEPWKPVTPLSFSTRSEAPAAVFGTAISLAGLPRSW